MAKKEKSANEIQIVTLNEQNQVNALVKGWKNDEVEGWTKVATVIDSGCVEHVGPPEMASEVAMVPSTGSSRGQTYSVANGEDLDNLSQKMLIAHTAGGQSGTVTYQMAKVTKPLFSVGQACDDGNLVIFGSKGGMVYNVNSKTISPFKRVNRNYEMELWLKKGEQGFPRQG